MQLYPTMHWTVILTDAKRIGSLKESFLQHAGDYGIDNIEYLFPDARTTTNTQLRGYEWVKCI